MTTPQQMPSTRRRRIPGMASQPTAPPLDPTATEPQSAAAGLGTAPVANKEPAGRVGTRGRRAPADDRRSAAASRPARQPASDYASTRLVNFRIPVDLHDRFRGLVHEAELSHPRLRRPNLTELLIALLEEGPQTADEVAELIRRKRAAEYEER